MNFQPGQKVAHQIKTRPDCLMLGVVQPGGQTVSWTAMVSSEGHVQHMGSNGPMPIKGDERPCPPEFANF